MSLLIEALLKNQGLDMDFDRLGRKEKKKTSRKLKRVLKELEFIRRQGGITVVIEGECIITTYTNNSLDRNKRLNDYKVIY